MLKQMSDNEIYLLVKYIKSVLWRVAKRLSYMEDARCLKVKYSRIDILYHHEYKCHTLIHRTLLQYEDTFEAAVYQ